MRKPKSKSKNLKIQSRNAEADEIQFLQSWIESGKPPSGSNPLSYPPLDSKSPIGRLRDGSFSRYAGCVKFSHLPLSKKTKDGLAQAKFVTMTDIQRASLPHALCGRDILGGAKTGSGKTLAFIIPVLEKLYQASWSPEDGVGCIIISPTRELANQTFDVLKKVGKYHSFTVGLIIGGYDASLVEEQLNYLNILVCTPGRLLQHMHGTTNFECSQLQVLVLDEADRILDEGFKKELNAIISQLPKRRQTFLYSATQTKSVQDLARLSLKDPEYLSVHAESATATPDHLEQTVMIVSLDKKLDMLWSFIKAHLNSRILVFLSTCKQVKFAFETFKKLRPGIPLKCLHGRMKPESRPLIYAQCCEKNSVLFCTDVASRGLDFNKGVDWVVQVDCPPDVESYIHRVGRTARYHSVGKSVLFLMPSEMKMLEKLHGKNIPIKLIKANTKKVQPVSGLLSALLVKYPNLQQLAQRAFITYLKSIQKQKDKEVFNVTELEIEDFSASMGIPMTPNLRFLKLQAKGGKVSKESQLLPEKNVSEEDVGDLVRLDTSKSNGEDIEREIEPENDLLFQKEIPNEEKGTDTSTAGPATRILKKKKLKINLNRPIGTRMVFDEDGNTLPPLALLAESNPDSIQLDKDIVNQRYEQMRKEMKMEDTDDKNQERKRRREKRLKEKLKMQRGQESDESELEDEDDLSPSEREESKRGRPNKKGKIYFNSDSDDDNDMKANDKKGVVIDSVSLAEQEELALKLLSSMH